MLELVKQALDAYFHYLPGNAVILLLTLGLTIVYLALAEFFYAMFKDAENGKLPLKMTAFVFSMSVLSVATQFGITEGVIFAITAKLTFWIDLPLWGIQPINGLLVAVASLGLVIGGVSVASGEAFDSAFIKVTDRYFGN